MNTQASTSSEKSPRRWDPLVRLTHWGIVIAVIANGLVTEEGSGAHVWIGYGLAALLALRLLWGFIGPNDARFAAFAPSPRRAASHIRAIARGERAVHASHNPLGALNVYAIWTTLIVIIGAGVAMAGPPSLETRPRGEYSQGLEHSDGQQERAEDEAHGRQSPQAVGNVQAAKAREGEDGGGEALEEIHESAVYLLYLLIALHLGGVIFETRRNGPSVVSRMMPGKS